MGTLVNGIKEIFATAKTTGSNVMLCDNDGTPDGHMTMANLASVLGALQFTGSEHIQDLNDLQYGCAYSGNMNNVGHAPTIILSDVNSQASVICIQVDWLGRGFQLAISKLGLATRFHSNNSPNMWNEWKRVDEGAIPSFYKDYSTLASLASALGGLYQISVINSGDVNDLGSGIYGVNAQLTNAPSNTGASMLIIMEAGWIRCDVILDRETAKLFYRFKWGSAGFEEWKLIR